METKFGMTEKEYLQSYINKHRDYYLAGKLEWSDPNYTEYPKDIFGNADYLWLKADIKNGLYTFAIGISPDNADRTVSKEPISIVEILEFLVCSPVVAIGRSTERGTPVMKIPEGVRLEGMSEFIKRK